MEIFHFIKWWWNRRSAPEQIVITMPVFMVTFFVSLFLFGFKALLFFILLVVGVLVGHLFYMIFKAFRQEWYVYRKEKEREAQMIVDRLKGNI